MDLRPELMPPPLDAARVARLAGLAAGIDGARPGQWEDDLTEFNRLAGTALTFLDFQGISGGTDHDTWVRVVLSEPAARPVPDVTRDELRELIRRPQAAAGDEHEVAFWVRLLEANLPGGRVSDLIFGAGDGSPVLPPEQVLDLARRAAGLGP